MKIFDSKDVIILFQTISILNNVSYFEFFYPFKDK